MHISQLFIYPVKSLRGLAVPAADVDALGLVGDRRFLVVNEHGQFLTQRTLPRMALVETALTSENLVLSHPLSGSCTVPLQAASPPELVSVQVWKSQGLLAEHCGAESAAWLSDFLGFPCRLARIGEKFRRELEKPGKSKPGDVLAFTDGYPFMILSESSLAELNGRLAQPLPVNRFRPSFVVEGCDAFAEDAWKQLRVGDVYFRTAGPCARCIVTTTNQLTAERGHEPLRTLAKYRRDAEDPTDVNFGQNLIHETKTGRIRVGDTVEAS